MRPWLKILAIGLLFGGACTEPPVKNSVAPVGVMRGTFLYSGPPPCTEKGVVVGTGMVLVFNQNLLPPPDGLASRSAAVKVIAGERLFVEAAKTLRYNADGSRYCPPPGTPPILASTDWDLSPFPLGNYQIRAFYDYDGDFHPAFRFSNLPTKGDITGGAIDNVTAALQGAPPIFTNLRVGLPDAQGGLSFPDGGSDGVLVDNITVAVALPSPFSRPYFHIAEVVPGKRDDASPPGTPELRPSLITMPSDWQLGNASPTAAQPFLWRLRLDAQLPPEEEAAAMASPFNMKLRDHALPLFRFDVDRDGLIGIPSDAPPSRDNVVGQPIAPAIGPIVSMQKLDPTDPIRRTPQANPRVLNSAVAMNAEQSTGLLSFQARPNTPVLQQQMWALIRPTAVCIPEATDPNGETTVVTPFAEDKAGGKVIPDEDGILTDISLLVRRARGNFKIVYACLPPGDFSVNTIIPTTGQAWTIPNESGVCMPGEAAGNGTCGTRARLTSQGANFRFGPAAAPAACVERFRALSAEDQDRYKRTCLRPDEVTRLEAGTLWSE